MSQPHLFVLPALALAVLLLAGCGRDEAPEPQPAAETAAAPPATQAPAEPPRRTPPARPMVQGSETPKSAACRMIPPEDVEAILAAPVRYADVSAARGQAMAEAACEIRRAGAAEGPAALRVELATRAKWTRSDKSFDDYWLESTRGNDRASALPGLQERAWFIPRQRADVPMVMIQGSRGRYEITPLLGSEDRVTREELALLAEALLAAER